MIATLVLFHDTERRYTSAQLQEIFESSAPHYRGMDGLRSKVYVIDEERGEFGGFYLWDPSKLGYVTYYAAKALVDGKITGKPGDSFTVDKGKWPGTYTIGQNGQIITGQPVEFTKDNYKNYNF